MASKKQTSLSAFFKPKEPVQVKPSDVSTVGKKVENVKKEISTPRSSSKRELAATPQATSPDSPISLRKSSTKRRRVVLSSDEEDDCEMEEKSASPGNEENTTPPPKSVSTPKTARKLDTSIIGTPSSIRTEVAASYIKSFQSQANDEDILNCTVDSVATLDRTIYQMDDKKSGKNKTSGSAGLDVNDDLFLHETFDFLKPSKIRDANKRRPEDPDYDPSTLYLPETFWKDQTPGHKQWWTLKSQYFDTVLFFKVGKFYELYHMDAVLGVKHLSLTYMRGNYAHAGFPESAYGRFADQLVSRGFKVARVEQTETPQQLEERSKKEKVKDKVVKRELCRVTSCGTRTFGVLDGNDNASSVDIGSDTAGSHLMAIKERGGDHCTYGICVVDTTIGKFDLIQFTDDEYRSQLRTLIANFRPSQVLLERGNLVSYSKNIVNCMLSSVPKEFLAPKTQFLPAEKTVQQLTRDHYLGADTSAWPNSLRTILDPDRTVVSPRPEYEECWSAFGAVLTYLQRCLIDVEMVTMRSYNLHDHASSLKFMPSSASGVEKWRGKRLVLDGITLENLNLVPVEAGPGRSRDVSLSAYSLYSYLNKCSTPFGKRLLREWICVPSCDPETLEKRQNGVEFVIGEGMAFAEKAQKILKQLPDLERLLQKIHTLGLKHRAMHHPDSRAIMFESSKYNKRKIKDLLMTLQGFELCRKLVELYDEHRMDGESVELFDQLIGVGEIPDIDGDLKHFKNAFNHKEAEEHGVIVPKPGMDPEYDSAIDSVNNAERALEDYRRKITQKYGCKVAFFGTGKNRYQMEIPENVKVSHDFELSSKRKGFSRFLTSDLRDLIEELIKAESDRNRLTDDATRKVFADFDARKAKWSSVVDRASQLDIILSFGFTAKNSSLNMCRPVFVYDSEKPVMQIESGYHPCLASLQSTSVNSNQTSASVNYIPNDTRIGGDSASTILLTGPNMGGKSTLMRQVSVLTVLAHLGAFVPAKSMSLSPVDRIFTRIGANDRIMAGQSTFFVELNETRVILRDATRDSLVIVDELGRGTSTFDGTAIASAVLSDLANRIQCRSFFSTHYHSLCEKVLDNGNVSLAHMACVVENENTEDPTEESVTFLYTLTDGVCPKSYGFFAAKLAGVKDEVVRAAYKVSGRLGGCGKVDLLREAARRGETVEGLRARLALI